MQYKLSRHNHINNKYFLHCPRQFLFVIPHLRTGTNPISRNSQLRKQCKICITELAKDTLPVPSGDKIRETYGNVIKGKINDDIVSNAFIMKFILIEVFFTSVLLMYISTYYISFSNRNFIIFYCIFPIILSSLLHLYRIPMLHSSLDRL